MSERVARRRIFRGKVYPADRERNPYLLLPFEVPPGTKAVEIRYGYDRGKNVLDLGVFDPRGHEFLSAEGFRGWSGSARDRVVIGEDRATLGYLPGPLYPGTWHVILGLYRLGPEGCDYEVEVKLHPDPMEAIPGASPGKHRAPELAPGGAEKTGWLRGDLHCHTHHSEAQGSVGDLVAAAERKGLDFLAITEHNTISHWKEMEELRERTEIILIPGEEITTYRGHANVWGWGRWLDFRCRTRTQMERVYAVAASEGRVFSINHPKPGGPPWEFGYDLPFDCMEVWHGLWGLGNETSLALWDSLLRTGRRVVAVGGSDAHPRLRDDGTLFEWVGLPTTWVFAVEGSPEGVLAGIRRGSVSISACPEGPLLLLLGEDGENFSKGMGRSSRERARVEIEVRGGEGLDLILIGRTGVLLRERVPKALWRRTAAVDLAREGFVRAELRVPVPGETYTKGPLAALSNPVWYDDFIAGKI